MKWDFFREFLKRGVSRTGRCWDSPRSPEGGQSGKEIGGIGGVGLYCFDGFFKGDAMGDAAT